MSNWIYSPHFEAGEATRTRATVETVYDDWHGNYVGVLRAADGQRYTHSVREGSAEDLAKCHAFDVRDLSELEGKALDIFVQGKEVVGARLVE